jgi:electron transport complex protein RnfG
LKKDFAMPILVLSLVCLFISGALAAGNYFTKPVIEEAAAARAEIARKEILPLAEGFTSLETDGLPKSVKEAYAASGGLGYIFVVTSSGYGGEVVFMCGISPDGFIIRSKILQHTETPGFGDKAFALAHASEERGAPFHGLTGATITSNAYKRAMQDALDAFETVKGAGF